MKTLIIFDIDGTLLYSNKADSICFSESYEAIFSKKFPSIDWENFPHVTDHTIFNTAFEQQFGREVTTSELERFQHAFIEKMKGYRKKSPEEFNPVPNSKETIDRLLKDENYVLGIATGGWEMPAKFKLDHIGINYAPIFDSYADNKDTREEIVQESIDNAKKKHPDIERIVYIGDAIWDVRTMRNMQLPLVGIRWKGDFEELINFGAKQVLQNYTDYDLFLETVKIAETPE